MFEAAIKIQKESKKHVHILIDEIDSILKKQELTSHGEFNLTLEFQTLMDGVLHYPSLTVWGTTNNPHHIPMPMLRRFSCVLIVGELDQKDRIKLLKQYADYLPVAEFGEEKWAALAKKLDGATGDVIRKVIDHVWRTKMNWFVRNHKDEARALIDNLNDGEKFDIFNFDSKQRSFFKNKLSQHMTISPEDLEISVDIHLKNVAVHNEIITAKQVYKEAREFLAQIEN